MKGETAMSNSHSKRDKQPVAEKNLDGYGATCWRF